MKIISALLGLSVCLTSFFVPLVLANDGPYEVLVTGNYDRFMTNLGGRAGYEYLQAMNRNSTPPSNSSGSSTSSTEIKAKHDYFCSSEPGIMLSNKNTCYQNASARDQFRQSNCSNFSFSFSGVGWTNPCRADSALQYRTDTARCDVDYQDNVNSYNAICNVGKK